MTDIEVKERIEQVLTEEPKNLIQLSAESNIDIITLSTYIFINSEKIVGRKITESELASINLSKTTRKTNAIRYRSAHGYTKNYVLTKLMEHVGKPVDLTLLMKELNMGRNGIGEAVRRLREEGYEINTHKGFGERSATYTLKKGKKQRNDKQEIDSVDQTHNNHKISLDELPLYVKDLIKNSHFVDTYRIPTKEGFVITVDVGNAMI